MLAERMSVIHRILSRHVTLITIRMLKFMKIAFLHTLHNRFYYIKRYAKLSLMIATISLRLTQIIAP